MKLTTTILALLLSFAIHAQNFNMCSSGNSTTNTTGNIFDSGGPSANYSDSESCTFLIEPACASSITMTFNSFNTLSGDFIEIFDGDQAITSSRILFYSNSSFTPSPVTANSGKMLIRFTSDGFSNAAGFSANWTSVITAINPPISNFTSNVSNPNYNQTIQFFDNSSNNPANRLWDFGDSTFSTLTNPTKVYNKSGTYKVSLTTENCLGSDVITKNMFIRAPSGFDVNPKIIGASTTTCGDSVIVPVKIYNTSSNVKTYTVTKNEGYLYEATEKKNFTTTSAINSFSFNPITEVVQNGIEISVNLEGSFSQFSNYADLYIEGVYINRLYSSSAAVFYPSRTVQGWMTDGKIDIELRNSSNVFIQIGNNSHEVVIRSRKQNWIDVQSSITVNANDSATLNVKLKSANLAQGVNTGSIQLNNGGTVGFPFNIPVELTVSGNPTFAFNNSNISNNGVVPQFTSITDTFLIKNIGCGTLIIDSIKSTDPFLVQLSSITTINALMQSEFITNWRPSTVGNLTDTVTLYTNDGNFEFYFTANVTPSPFAFINPAVIYDTLTDCGDSLSIPVILKNLGTGNLQYYTNISNSFDSTSQIVYTVSGASTNHSFSIPSNSDTVNLEIIIDGDFDSSFEYADLSIEGTFVQRLGGLGSLNYTYNLQLFGAQLNNWLLDGLLDIRFQNTSSVNIFSSQGNFHSVKAFYNGSTPWIYTQRDSGIVVAGDSTIINYTVNDLFVNGDYSGNILISTNGAQGVVNIPVFLNVNGTATAVFSDTCMDFGSVQQNSISSREITLVNTGCDSLLITGISNTNPDFSSSYNASVLDVGDTSTISLSFSKTSLGNSLDTVLLTTNIGTFKICLSATAVPAPTLVSSPPLLFGQVFNCGDSIIVPLKLKNTGLGDLIYSTTDSTIASSPSSSLKILLLTNSASGTELNNLTNLITGQFPTATISYIFSNSASDIRDSLVGKNLLIIPEVTNSTQLLIGSTEIQNFVNQGGGLIQIGARSTGILTAPGIFQGLFIGNTSSSLMTSVGSHPVNSGLPFSFSASNATFYYSITTPNFNRVVELLSNDAVGTLNYGSGKAVLIGYDYFAYSVAATDVLFNSINWAKGGISGPGADWLGGTNPLDTIAGNDSIILNIPFYSDSLSNGFYYSQIVVNSNDPTNPTLIVPCTLQVSGLADLAFNNTASCFNFGTVPNNSTSNDSVIISNTGCDTLNIQGVSFVNTAFSASFTNATILPGDSATISLSFNPSTVGTTNDSLVVQFNGTSKKLCVTGVATPSPNIQVTPTPVLASIVGCNDSTSIPITINNLGSGLLRIDSVSVNVFDNSLDTIMSRFSNSGNTLTSLLPNNYNFLDGIFGSSINDGGGDMYDGGNQLNLLPQGSTFPSLLAYSDNLVTTVSVGGNSIPYFTSKIPGMFLFSADITNIQTFSIEGNLGADGIGSVNNALLSSASNGITYSGFVKRVYSAGDPSVNHLIIVENTPGISQTFSTNTDNDNHAINGLTSSTRVYYLLFAGISGRFYSDAEFQNVFDNFLQLINAGRSSSWVSIPNTSTTVTGGSSTTTSVKFKSTDLLTGSYNSIINVYSNDPSNPVLEVPCTLSVTGVPNLEYIHTSPCFTFGNQFRFSRTLDSIPVVNNGCDTAIITNASAGSGFTVTNYPTSLPPGDTAYVAVEFFPGILGTLSDSVKLFYQNGASKAYCLTGNSFVPPTITLSPSSLTASINVCNDSATRFLTIKNTGGATLDWNSKTNSTVYEDDFENGFNSNLWASTNTVTTFGTCGIINGSASALFTGSNRVLQTISIDARALDSVSFEYRNGGNCDRADGSEYLYFEYSLNGINWFNISTTSTFISGSTTLLLKSQLPISAKTSSTQFRFSQTSYSGTSNDFWIIDDFELIGSGARNNSSVFSLSQDSGSIASGDSSVITLKIKANTLTPGLQTLYVRVNSNDPLSPVDSIPVFLNINGVPCTDFTFDATTACNGSVTFRDTSKGNPTSWFWTFGDGNSSSLRFPTNVYSASGSYNARLVSCNSFGCDTLTQIVVVNSINAPISAACSPLTSNYCCGYGITTVNLNTIINSSGVGDYEDFTCSQQTTLTANNTYTLTLLTGQFEDVYAWIDYNNNGSFSSNEIILTSLNSSSHTTTFIIPSTAIINQPLRLRIGSQDNGAIALTGCNNPYRGQYEDYTVNIQSSNAAPVVAFTDTLISLCQGVASFSDNSLNFPTSWRWDFGDGNSSTLRNPFHTYSTRGTYQVKLITSNAFGSDSLTKTVIVDRPNPVINILGSRVPNSVLSFSLTGVTGGTNYSWNLGNGTTTTTTNPTTLYTSGTYTISVNLIDVNNCNINISTTINIIPVGVNETELDENQITLFPNPAINNITVATDIDDYNIRILNGIGAAVYESVNMSNNTIIDINHFAPSIYYLEILKGNSVTRKRFIKIR